MHTVSEPAPRIAPASPPIPGRPDLIAGFLVFLIALPLCLGIALASGYPAVAGILAAVVGGLLTPWISDSALTIKGPAAGLIVIALGAINEFSAIYGPDRAYPLALGVGVAAGLIQILFGLSKSGKLGEFFPTTVVHGMLAAIGVIIMAKQIHVTLGVMDTHGEPLELIREIPNSIARLNPEIALIGGISLLILFVMPMIKHPLIRKIPSPLVVILVAVPMGLYFGLTEEHTYSFGGHDYSLGERFLVPVPQNLLKAITFPDFSGLRTLVAWKWVALFALIGSLESILSAKAIDLMDPWQRKTNLNRDLIAIGIGNTVAAGIGGFPMISEIVRSKAAVDNGARTRFTNLFHGLFLLGFVALVPGLLHRIPLAALSAMLVYTGARLASPREFQNVSRIGKEQLLIFVITLVGVLATDLLVGVGIGIAAKLAIHVLNGVPILSLFRPYLDIEPLDDNTSLIRARRSAVFSNWIPFKSQIEQIGLVQHTNLVIDLSEAKFVDHHVMEKLHELQVDFENQGLSLELVGLETHKKLSSHEHAARRQGYDRSRRITVIIDAAAGGPLCEELVAQGADRYTLTPCLAVGGTVENGSLPSSNGVQWVRCEIHVPTANVDPVMRRVRRALREDRVHSVSAETIERIES